MIDVFISVGRTANEEQEAFVRAVMECLRANGLNPRALGRSDWSSEQPLKFIEKLMDQCAGTVIIAFERLYVSTGIEHRLSEDPVRLSACKVTTPWNQVEAAMAYSRRQPLFVLVESGLRREGLIDEGFDWWVQACPLEAASMQTPEFIGVFNDWKKRVEEYSRGNPLKARQLKPDVANMSIFELIGALRPSHLWATSLVIASLLGSVFTAGHTWGPIVIGHEAQAAQSPYDDRATLNALRALADKAPPYQGDSVNGNVRPQMEAYIKSYDISNNPKLLRTILSLLGEVEARESPTLPKEYFLADNSFRARLDTFVLKVRAYSETGVWDP